MKSNGCYEMTKCVLFSHVLHLCHRIQFKGGVRHFSALRASYETFSTFIQCCEFCRDLCRDLWSPRADILLYFVQMTLRQNITLPFVLFEFKSNSFGGFFFASMMQPQYEEGLCYSSALPSSEGLQMNHDESFDGNIDRTMDNSALIWICELIVPLKYEYFTE